MWRLARRVSRGRSGGKHQRPETVDLARVLPAEPPREGKTEGSDDGDVEEEEKKEILSVLTLD